MLEAIAVKKESASFHNHSTEIVDFKKILLKTISFKPGISHMIGMPSKLWPEESTPEKLKGEGG
jgi:hypothetical protein